MDTAVALVQAYLHVNGYFTVAEYPVLEAYQRDQTRAVTDLDILAFRFAHAEHDVKRGRGRRPLGGHPLTPDPVLGCPADQPDMIVGEVKEGPARFNAAAQDSVVLEVALTRFGCCPPSQVGPLTRQLLAQGRAVTPAGHSVRMVAFGDGSGDAGGHAWTCVPMRHVVEFLQAHLRQHWSVLRHAQIREPALGVLALIEKWRVGTAFEGGRSPGPDRRSDGSL